MHDLLRRGRRLSLRCPARISSLTPHSRRWWRIPCRCLPPTPRTTFLHDGLGCTRRPRQARLPHTAAAWDAARGRRPPHDERATKVPPCPAPALQRRQRQPPAFVNGSGNGLSCHLRTSESNLVESAHAALAGAPHATTTLSLLLLPVALPSSTVAAASAADGATAADVAATGVGRRGWDGTCRWLSSPAPTTSGCCARVVD